jgi:cytochrome c oxidase subunit 2
MTLAKLVRALWGIPLTFLICTDVFADKPERWHFNFQEAATPVMEKIHELHNLVMLILVLVALFVFAIMGLIIYKFRASKNPTPSTKAHNTLLEVIWTAAPVLILLIIAVPSFKLIFYMDKAKDPELTLKITGHMWYWSYEYPEQKIAFDSTIIPDDQLKPGQLRLLEVDNQIIVPVNTTIRLLFTAVDVLHSWTVPSFGVKKDCVPGRLNEAWIYVEREGTFYGQCSEICGMKHGFMPIVVKVVSKEEFQKWVGSSKTKVAHLNHPALDSKTMPKLVSFDFSDRAFLPKDINNEVSL